MRLTLIPPIHSRLLPAPLSPLRPLVLSCGSWFPSTAQQPQLVVGRTLVPCAASRQPCCPDVSACLGRIGCVCHRSAAQHRTKARSVVPPLLLRQLYGPRNSCSRAGDQTDRNTRARQNHFSSTHHDGPNDAGMDRPGAAKSLAMWIYGRTRTRTGMQCDDDVDPSPRLLRAAMRN